MTSEPGFSDRFYTSTDGLKLHVRVYGERIDSATPVVCLPGLTRNARDFHELAIYLSQKAETPRKVIAFDYRGRGRSAYDRDWQNYNVVVEAGDVIAGLISVGVENGHFIGTSRGGLIIHMLGGMRPTLLKSVILNDVGPVLEGEGLAHIRLYLTRAPRPANMADAIAVQRTAHGAAFPALNDDDWMRFTTAIYKEQSGRPERDFDPSPAENPEGGEPQPTAARYLAAVRGPLRHSAAGHPRREFKAAFDRNPGRDGAAASELRDRDGPGPGPSADARDRDVAADDFGVPGKIGNGRLDLLLYDRQITQRLYQRLDLVFVFLPTLYRCLVDRLAHLPAAQRGDGSVGFVKAQACVVPWQAEKFDQPARFRLLVCNHRLIVALVNLARQKRLPMLHQAVVLAIIETERTEVGRRSHVSH